MIVEERPAAGNGETVVALITGETPTGDGVSARAVQGASSTVPVPRC
jgi:hypothetical protein